MKRKRMWIGIAAAVLLLTGCGGGESSGGEDGEGTVKETDIGESGAVEEVEIQLSNGRSVTCLVFVGWRKGGISCDWDGSRTAEETQ